MPLILTERDVRAVLPMADLIDAMAQAVGSYSAGAVSQPVRTTIQVDEAPSFFAVMPAALVHPGAVGAKLVTVFPRNHGRNLLSHLASILLLDAGTGALAALMDGRYITEARTAAVSAVSVRHLARSDAHVLAIVGSGVQAASHLAAIRLVRPLTEVRVWSPTADRREAFARAHSSDALPVRAVPDARTAVSGADIVVLATASRTPVVADADVAAGAHVCAVGACRPDQREMPTALVARGSVFVDSRAGALAEAGDLLIPIREGAMTDTHVGPELGAVVRGTAHGRRGAHDVTIFKSLGMAVEDVVAAHLVFERARSAGLGLTFDLQ